MKVGLEKAGLPAQVMIDFSHANSSKQFKKQMEVGADVCQQIAAGEGGDWGDDRSHLVEGNQNLEGSEPLVYGKSVTDVCIGWDDYRCYPASAGECGKSTSRATEFSVTNKKRGRLRAFFYIWRKLLRFTLVRDSRAFAAISSALPR